ncbi:MAG: hypothetical protein A2005_03890 [Desulfuromonadales bacterium GWC2_61_20]|nr:MAG: hypothetical protein A2005_03890 [Desulfuromonadales bacterium GWC2_61_20]
MAFLLYDLLLLAATLVLLPWYLLRRSIGGKARQGLRERLGGNPGGRFKHDPSRPLIWVHAVSVGETRAAIPLLRELKASFPEARLVLSSVTETGRAIAEGIAEVDELIYFPVDLSFVVRRVLARLRPTLIVIVETEIWPNFVRAAGTAGIPVVLVNGRISDRSFPRYLRLRPLLRPVLAQIGRFCMQSVVDGERIAALGAPPEYILVTGNIKYDMAYAAAAADRAALRQNYRLPEQVPVWVAGSTHAGEEEAVLRIYRQLLAAGREVLLVLVPRHPQRFAAVAAVLAAQQFSFVRRSQLSATTPLLAPGSVLLGDTLGEMLHLYAAADVVFVGGSLVPTGGHNILEASLVHRPVLFGPHMQNFREIAARVGSAAAGIQVADEAELLAALAQLLAAPEEAAAMGERGFAFLKENAGATAATVAALRPLYQARAEHV